MSSLSAWVAQVQRSNLSTGVYSDVRTCGVEQHLFFLLLSQEDFLQKS